MASSMRSTSEAPSTESGVADMRHLNRGRAMLVLTSTLLSALALLAGGMLPAAAATPHSTGTAATGTTTTGTTAEAATDSASATATTEPAGGSPRVVLGDPILTGFPRPILFLPRGASTAYVVEQGGIIRRVTYNSGTHTWSRAGGFLNISSRVTDPTGDDASEQGLLGPCLRSRLRYQRPLLRLLHLQVDWQRHAFRVPAQEPDQGRPAIRAQDPRHPGSVSQPQRRHAAVQGQLPVHLHR